VASKRGSPSKPVKKVPPKKVAPKPAPSGGYPGPLPGLGGTTHLCDLADICKYMKELDVWLKDFIKDYTNVRKALCNVERQAFNEGTGTQAGRFCKAGSHGSEPAQPTDPPGW
jgi:hypothetical protein